jgi:hypothetical protein
MRCWYFTYSIESQAKPKIPKMSEPNSSSQVHSHSSYVRKVTNTPINLEETYGQGFKILTNQGFDITNEHEIYKILDKIPIKQKKGIGYRDPPLDISVILLKE